MSSISEAKVEGTILDTWTETKGNTGGDPNWIYGEPKAWVSEGTEITGLDPPGPDREPGSLISGWRTEWDEQACTCDWTPSMDEEPVPWEAGTARPDQEAPGLKRTDGAHAFGCHQRQPHFWAGKGRSPGLKIPLIEQAKLWNEREPRFLEGTTTRLIERWLYEQPTPRSVGRTLTPGQGDPWTSWTFPDTVMKYLEIPDQKSYVWDKASIMIPSPSDPLDSLRDEVRQQAKQINVLERRLRKLKRRG